MASEPQVEYTREYLSDLQQAYELAADEAAGIKDYLVAIEDIFQDDESLVFVLRTQRCTSCRRLINDAAHAMPSW